MTIFKIGQSDVSLKKGGSSVVVRYEPEQPEEVNLRPLSELQTEINNAADGAVLDLAGDYFRPTSTGDAAVAFSKNVTIKNCTITATADTTWTAEPGMTGVYSAPLPVLSFGDLTYDDPRLYIIDDGQEETPYLQARPQITDSTYTKYSALAKSSYWYYLDIPTDPTSSVTFTGDMKVSVDALMAGEDVAKTKTFYNAAGNVMGVVANSSYDPVTGVLTFASSISPASQFSLAFTGLDPSAHLNAGEFCIRTADQKIYYCPANGDPSEARLPVIASLLRLTGLSDQTVTLDNVTIHGGMASSTANACVTAAYTGSNAATLATRNGTVFRNCGIAIKNVRPDFQDSEFFDFVNRGGTGLFGGQMLRCYGGNAANQSLMRWSGDTAETILVRDCMFFMPISTHGQVISFYEDSFQRATVDHNIFYNCGERSIALAHTASETVVSNVGTFSYTNNLCYVDSIVNEVTNPASYHIRHISIADAKYDKSGQELDIRSNTWAVSQEILGNQSDPNALKMARLVLGSCFYYRILMANNFFSSRTLANSEEYQYSVQNGVGSLNNAQYTVAAFDGYAQSDTQVAGYTISFNPSTLQMTGDLTTWATDGGTLGIRWQSIPSSSEIGNLDRTWASSYPALSIPTPNFPTDPNDIIVEGDDKRP